MHGAKTGRAARRILGAAALLALATGCAAFAARAPLPSEEHARTWADRLGGHPQRHNLSCESRAACDLLAAHGIAVREDSFLAALPRSDDPERGFVGDVDGPGGRLPPEGYGVHAPPVAATLRAFGLDASAERGRDLRWLKDETAAGRPVLAWTTYGCRPGARTTVRLPGGRTASAVLWEHAVLVVGWTSRGTVVWLDPAWGERREADDAAFDASWSLFDREAVSSTGPLVAAAPR